MNRNCSKRIAPHHLLGWLAAAAFLFVQPVFGAATVATNQSDYSPGDTVTITGAGFQPGETVTLRIVENPDLDGDSPITWNVVADATGGFVDGSFHIDPADLGITFTLTATGQTSGSVAQTSFVDASNVKIQRSANTFSFSFTYQFFTSNNCTTGGGAIQNGSVTTNGGNNIGAIASGGSVKVVANMLANSPATWTFHGWVGDSTPTSSSNPSICIPGGFSGANNWTATYVGQPDLTATKSNNLSNSTTTPGNNWTWKIKISNTGNADAVFANTQTILSDSLPNSNINYSSPAVGNVSAGVLNSGNISCTINGTYDLTCKASGASVTLQPNSSFEVTFTATPTATGTFANPRSGGSCMVDPGTVVTESDEDHNGCSDTVTVNAPDLTATKSDSVSNNTTLGNNWTWKIKIANTGNADAVFANTQTILSDSLPNSNINYSSPAVGNVSAGVLNSGNISCTINGTYDLTCKASGASVTLQPNSSFEVTFTATPTATGTFANPRSGGSCMVDPGTVVTESDEDHNGCSDTVTVNAPDLTATKSDSVSNNTTLGNNWTWKIKIANTGNADAVFANTQTILSDSLPNSNINYSSPAVGNVSAGVLNSGNISCTINGTYDLTCKASGASVTLQPNSSFEVTFTATPTAKGTFANPRSGGSCMVDPGTVVTESDEDHNGCSDTVTVNAPDLTATKSDSVSNNTTLGNNWTWTIKIANTGNADAVFANTQTILSDSLPNSNINYSSPAVGNVSAGVLNSANISCTINGTYDLTCKASGASVTLQPNSSFEVTFTATPTATGTFANPRSGGSCMVDPGTVVTESDEDHNGCSDTVTVNAPDLTATKLNNVGGSVAFDHSWTWKITVANGGNGPALYANGQTVFIDNLPNSNLSYGPVSVTRGDISCSISSSDLSCTASGAVSIAQGSSFDISFNAKPLNTGTFANPRAGGSCLVDPDHHVTESDENNNACSDTVTVVFGQRYPDSYLIGYAANLLVGDSVVNFTNTGERNGFDPAGNVCANIYAFDADQQMIACCSCYLTPNHLKTVSVRQDLVNNTLTPGVPASIVIKLVASDPINGSSCDPTSLTAPTLERGMRAWGTTIHQATTGTYQVTETAFQQATLSVSEVGKLASYCGYIKANGSGYGICNSCREGALGAARR